MSKNLRLYLEIAEEAKRLTMEGLEFQEALRQAKEMYKKSCSQPASNENNDNEKILNDILTDKESLCNNTNERHCIIRLTENQAYYLEKFLGLADIDDTENICKKYYIESHLYHIEKALYEVWEQIHKNMENNKFY